MTSPSYFDANCMVGTPGRTNPRGLVGTEAVLAEARRCGVDRVLAYHALAREWDPHRGSALLASELGRFPQLAGCWVGDPAVILSAAAATAVVDRVITAGSVSLRLFPDPLAHRFDMCGRSVTMLLAACEERRLPVFVDTAQPDWHCIESTLRRHPALPLVLTGINYRWGRDLHPLLDSHRLLHVETASFVAHGELEDVTERFGSSHLIFGTNSPRCAVGGALARVHCADLPAADKAAIAGDNLRRLIEDVRRS